MTSEGQPTCAWPEYERHLGEIVGRLTEGRFGVIPEFDTASGQRTQWLYVTRRLCRGKWTIPPEPFSRLYYALACKIRLDVDTYVATQGAELPVDVLDARYQALAYQIEEAAVHEQLP